MDKVIFILSDVYDRNMYKLNENFNFVAEQIISNRVQGIAYRKIDNCSCSKEVYYTLKNSYIKNINSNLFYQSTVTYLSSILKECKVPYAFIKGAFLIPALYKTGQRASDDIDILINEKNIGELQSILIENGFRQGTFNDNLEFFPADRSRILMSRMNYGETVPWVKLIDGRPVKVDISFSVDYKPNSNNDIVKKLLEKCITVTFEDYKLQTLAPLEFFIHLCCHLYKEATTYDWVRQRKDLMLYKFSDINVFLHEYGNQQFFTELSQRVRELGVEKKCYYTCENASIIYPHILELDGFESFLDQIQPDNLLFMRQIIYPQGKKLFTHNMDFISWFFCEDRIAYLNKEAKCETLSAVKGYF